MKILKPIFSVVAFAFATVLFMSISTSSFAQQTPPPADQKQTRTEPQGERSHEEMKKDYEERMQKFDELSRKLDEKSKSTNDPKMKADIASFQGRMQLVKTDMDNYINNKNSMTPEQQEQAKSRIHTQMDDLKRSYEEMKTKYGKSKGAGSEAKDKQPKEKKQTETAPKQ